MACVPITRMMATPHRFFASGHQESQLDESNAEYTYAAARYRDLKEPLLIYSNEGRRRGLSLISKAVVAQAAGCAMVAPLLWFVDANVATTIKVVLSPFLLAAGILQH